MYNKIIMALMAGGLWANAAAQWSMPAKADTESYLSQIEANTRALAQGGAGCRNLKICD